MYYMGFSYTEAMSLPIWQRAWFLDRMLEEIKNSNGQSKAAHSNSADQRALAGNMRPQVPANLRRFT
jgi:hypothetical protein